MVFVVYNSRNSYKKLFLQTSFFRDSLSHPFTIFEMDDALVILPPVSSVPLDNPPSSTRKSARRCLFGRADVKQTDAWLTERLNEIRTEQQRKWGFDFHSELPCASATSDFVFRAVSAYSVPHFYRLSYYPNESMNSSDSENRSPNTDDSDCSMERSPLQSPRKYQCTPLKQTKLTAYMKVQSRKRLQHAAKTNDLSSAASSSSASAPMVRRFKSSSQ
uniref:Cyclin-dependent kinase inhibitor domain-containing protein n=1 Tax=Parascaris univalens TaxID=6257 RepID=A0A915APT5_PARUN